MIRYFTIIILLLIHSGAFAQLLEGTTIDTDHKTAISGISVYNTHSGNAVYSDSNGRFAIGAATGDTLLFRHTAYQTLTYVMPYAMGNTYKTILMASIAYQLKEATINGRTKYQQDSAALHALYSPELNKVLVPTPHYTGFGCSGCFGWLADKITGNSKKPKRFKKQFAADDQARFIDSRYNPELVTALTGIQDVDSIAAFMKKYPLEYDFARSASDLEIKAWIRSNYRDYKQTTFIKNS